MASRVLIIEDDRAIRQLLHDILEGAGYVVVEAKNGREGLHLFQKHPCDLVLTDILMPEVDGVGVIREMRSHHPGVPIVALSGGGMTVTAETSLQVARKLGVNRTLSKPFAIAQVLDVVADLLAEG
ncbi:MAG: response regulator [Magnetococcales bacterium]|nr:response regulator [Magnetococcales bacterium]